MEGRASAYAHHHHRRDRRDPRGGHGGRRQHGDGEPNANPYKLNKEGTLTVGMTLQFAPQMYLDEAASPPATTSCC